MLFYSRPGVCFKKWGAWFRPTLPPRGYGGDEGALRAGDGKAAPGKPGRLSVTIWMTDIIVVS